MKFKINNTEWIIKEVDEAIINNEVKQDEILGLTIYKTLKIVHKNNIENYKDFLDKLIKNKKIKERKFN